MFGKNKNRLIPVNCLTSLLVRATTCFATSSLEKKSFTTGPCLGPILFRYSSNYYKDVSDNFKGIPNAVSAVVSVKYKGFRDVSGTVDTIP